MKFPSTISRTSDGQVSLRHESPQVGTVEVKAATRQEAIEKLVGEIRYRLELCPCTGETYQHIEVEITDAS